MMQSSKNPQLSQAQRKHHFVAPCKPGTEVNKNTCALISFYHLIVHQNAAIEGNSRKPIKLQMHIFLAFPFCALSMHSCNHTWAKDSKSIGKRLFKTVGGSGTH